MTIPKKAESDDMKSMSNQPIVDPPVVQKNSQSQTEPPLVAANGIQHTNTEIPPRLEPRNQPNEKESAESGNPKAEKPHTRMHWEQTLRSKTEGETSAAIEPSAPLLNTSESPSDLAPVLQSNPISKPGNTLRGKLLWPLRFLGRTIRRAWDITCLLVLLAVVSAVPILQFASLGYLLLGARNLAEGKPWRSALPGRRKAGRLGIFVALAFLLWLPVWLVTDLSYTAQLLQPNSRSANLWRIGAFAISFAWVSHVGWAAIRGARWWHLLWPAPLRFLKYAWRPSTWAAASDRLYDWVTGLQFGKLWWLGTRAAVGALLWIAIPVSMMIIGQRAYDLPIAPLVGIVGAISMFAIMFYLPFLQIQLAIENRMLGIVNFRAVRRRFRHAPVAHAIALFLLCLLSLPLYLLRIEATPAELLWAPSIVFVLFMLPVKAVLGAAISVGERRYQEARVRHWTLRWGSRFVMAAGVIVYVGALYFAQLFAGQGALVMYFQHALLVPAPLISS